MIHGSKNCRTGLLPLVLDVHCHINISWELISQRRKVSAVSFLPEETAWLRTCLIYCVCIVLVVRKQRLAVRFLLKGKKKAKNRMHGIDNLFLNF